MPTNANAPFRTLELAGSRSASARAHSEPCRDRETHLCSTLAHPFVRLVAKLFALLGGLCRTHPLVELGPFLLGHQLRHHIAVAPGASA
uniref:hypothetical protein n=1 Tax=Altererythrobacter segetis TaxID=1104773 RepID=UPI00140B8C3C|nr:hypothetical protein [Altererythrobacter segetis]